MKRGLVLLGVQLCPCVFWWESLCVEEFVGLALARVRQRFLKKYNDVYFIV